MAYKLRVNTLIIVLNIVVWVLGVALQVLFIITSNRLVKTATKSPEKDEAKSPEVD